MITAGMNYHVIAGKQTDFENKFSAVLATLGLNQANLAGWFAK